MRIGGGPVAEELGVRARATRAGDLGLLEHEQRRALAHDEPVAAGVERSARGDPGSSLWPGRQRPDDVERPEGERRQRDLARRPRSPRRPGRRGGRRAPRRARPRPRRTSSRSTGSARARRGRCRGWRAPHRRRPPARGSARPAGCPSRGSARAGPRRRRSRRAPSRGRCRSGRGPRRRRAPGGRPASSRASRPATSPNWLNRSSCRAIWRHPGERVEVVDLGGDLRAERRRVEAVDPLDRRAAGAERQPRTPRARSRRR